MFDSGPLHGRARRGAQCGGAARALLYAVLLLQAVRAARVLPRLPDHRPGDSRAAAVVQQVRPERERRRQLSVVRDQPDRRHRPLADHDRLRRVHCQQAVLQLVEVLSAVTC